MEENTYPLFLKSDLYLEYTRTGGESPKPNPSDQSPSSGPVKPVPGYLPTLAEDEEWRLEDASPPSQRKHYRLFFCAHHSRFVICFQVWRWWREGWRGRERGGRVWWYTSGKADSQPADADGTTEGLNLPEESARQQRVQVCVRITRDPYPCTQDCLYIKTLVSEFFTDWCPYAVMISQ